VDDDEVGVQLPGQAERFVEGIADRYRVPD
jgi:hypothetical protein